MCQCCCGVGWAGIHSQSVHTVNVGKRFPNLARASGAPWHFKKIPTDPNCALCAVECLLKVFVSSSVIGSLPSVAVKVVVTAVVTLTAW
jgi:hypothetical protein